MASDPTVGDARAEMPVEGAESAPQDGAPSVAELRQLITQLEAEKAELHDRHLRAVAESQNIRRRGQQDVERAQKFGVERFAKDVLSVADNLGRALSALPTDGSTLDPAVRNVVTGVQATERELQSVLERHGVTRVEALGKPFNAEFHQAMLEVEDASVPSGTIVQELAPGYLIAGRLLRAAMVSVSKGGPARSETAPQASNEN